MALKNIEIWAVEFLVGDYYIYILYALKTLKKKEVKLSTT